MARSNRDGKSQRKSHGLPPHLTPGNPGNSGGKPGRSGRVPDAFRSMCRRLASRKATLAAVEEILRNSNHPMFMSALNWATNHGYGKAKETHEHIGPDDGPIKHALTIRWGNQEVTF